MTYFGHNGISFRQIAAILLVLGCWFLIASSAMAQTPASTSPPTVSELKERARASEAQAAESDKVATAWDKRAAEDRAAIDQANKDWGAAEDAYNKGTGSPEAVKAAQQRAVDATQKAKESDANAKQARDAAAAQRAAAADALREASEAARSNQARAAQNLAAAKQDLAAKKAALAAGTGSQAEVDEAARNVDQAQKQVDAAKTSADETSALSSEASKAAGIADTCTQSPIYNVNPDDVGILSRVAKIVIDIVTGAAKKLFEGITGSPVFQKAIWAAITLSIAIYGALFLLGLAQLSLADGAVRMIKIGIIITILSPAGWGFFNDYVGRFFMQGTNQLINAMTAVAIGADPSTSSLFDVPVGPPSPGDEDSFYDQSTLAQMGAPLATLDRVVRGVFMAKMFITLLGLFFTMPYGPIFAILIIFGIGTLLAAVMEAMWIFLMSLVAKMLLLGLAPIFISFMLFEKTRHIFDGWINQLVGYSLQPILLFAFLGFYSVLIDSSLQTILRAELCWVEISPVILNIPFSFHFWRFQILDPASGAYMPYTGSWGWAGPDVGTGPVFPINIVDVLIFILLAQLAWRYTKVVVFIAKEISGATVYLSQMQGNISNWGSDKKAKIGEGAHAAAFGHDAGSGQRGVRGAAGFMEQVSGKAGKRGD